MQRKPGFPVANCSIKMPDNMSSLAPEAHHGDEDVEQQQRRQQLINFGHSQWGFNNWSWKVTKQELDFVDFNNGKYCAGVVAFVSITVKSFDIHRENIGYATTLAPNKGFAIYKSRKCAVTNALRETLLSFGGSVATDLMELVDAHKAEAPAPAPAIIPEPLPVPPPTAPVPVQIPAPMPEPAIENNQNIPNRPVEPKNSPLNMPLRKEDPANMRHPLKNVTNPPIAKAHPIPCALPPRLPAPQPRPNSNEVTGDDEEARAERKRRQRQAQEEFRLRQLQKQLGLDEKQELNKNASSFDKLLMELPSQDIVIEQTGDSADAKRKSPGDGGAAKRRASVMSRLDIRQAD